MRLRTLLALSLLSLPAFAQVEFEVASVKPSGDVGPGRAQVGLHIDGAQVTCNYFSLRDYIAIAWGVKQYQVTGPEWIENARFDVAAKIPSGVPATKVRDMMKALLIERFQLKVHDDKKDFPVYALIVTKNGPKLKESEGAPAETTGGVNISGGGDARGVSVNLGNGASYSFANGKFTAVKLTMAAFTDALGRFLEKPVADFTELPGAYDVTFDIPEEDFRGMQIRSAINAGVQLPPQITHMADTFTGDVLNSPLQKVGLRLESRKAALPVVVVDSANKTPAAN